MKFLSILSALTVFVAAMCNAQAKPKTNKSLLWRINGNGMSKSSYLFGTIHIICSDDYVWTNKMDESLKKADKVCFEMDMDDPHLMMQIASAMVDHSGKMLKDYFTAQEFEQLSQYLRDSMNTDIHYLQQMKPAVLLSMFASKSLDCANQASYETKIMEEAQKEKKEIIGLEQASEQIALLDGMPVDSVVKEVMSTINNPSDDKKEYANLVATYKQQDLPKLYELIQQSKELGDDMGDFLDVRNKKWISRMKANMNNQSVFFAVGAGHLWGENGVIQLLRKAGYQVEAVQ